MIFQKFGKSLKNPQFEKVLLLAILKATRVTSRNCIFFLIWNHCGSRILCVVGGSGGEMVLGSSKASWNSVRICKSALCFWPVRKHPLSSLLYYQSYRVLQNIGKKCNFREVTMIASMAKINGVFF